MLCNRSDAVTNARADGAPHRYRCCGLTILSDITLPVLREDMSADTADIVLRLGPVAPGELETRAGYRRNLLLDQFRYEARDGNAVTVELLPGAVPANVADLIVSRVLTILLYQRGLLPLHASAVMTPAGIVAICGVSGAGKSTLAATLASRGHPLVADDMLVVAPDLSASPAARGLKLSLASLGHVGRTSEGLAIANQVEGKYYLPFDAAAAPATAPIVRLVQLHNGPEGVTPLSDVAAAAGWRNCIRMPDLMDQAPAPAALWRQWLALVCGVENMAVSHGHRLETLDAIAAALEGGPEPLPQRLEAHG